MHDRTQNNSCKLQPDQHISFIKKPDPETIMTRTLFLMIAAVTAGPAFAATYSATPVGAPAAARIVGKDIGWSCADGSCRGVTENSRPLLLCQDLAKRAGPIASFAVDGRPLPDAALAQCNRSARSSDGASAR